MSVRVGVVGLGMMGLTHLDSYARLQDVEVVALADRDTDRLSGTIRAQGNIEGQAEGGFDFDKPKKYTDAAELIADPDVDAVDICLPTPAHLPFGLMALDAGKHLLVEKPLARTSEDAIQLMEAAEASDRIAMPALCMRFWPGWREIKETIADNRYGRLLAATFRRVTSHPHGPFYADGKANGGAALDLHIHDADFVQYLFGTPKSVSSIGYASKTGEIDHIVTQYQVEEVPVVTAEGSWAMSEGFVFRMQYTLNFDKATLSYDSVLDDPLTLARDGEVCPIGITRDGLGYDHELAYFIDCVKQGRKPQHVTMQDAANAIRLIEAEIESIKTGRSVTLDQTPAD